MTFLYLQSEEVLFHGVHHFKGGGKLNTDSTSDISLFLTSVYFMLELKGRGDTSPLDAVKFYTLDL